MEARYSRTDDLTIGFGPKWRSKLLFSIPEDSRPKASSGFGLGEYVKGGE